MAGAQRDDQDAVRGQLLDPGRGDVPHPDRDHDPVEDPQTQRLDGIGLTRMLRESPKFKTTPILILTTESSDQMKQAGRAAGATGWLVKPFDPNRLIEVIQKVIR